jgi:LysM repeat protein
VGARNTARVLAPLALVAALIAVVVVVQASKPGSSDSSGTPAATQRTTTQQRPPARSRLRVYVVKSGDTLTGVAERTGVALEEIQGLNPDVDPNALQTGQRLRLGP